jgi:16S rRNA (guanine966-N2)-methyltransferase
MRVVAGSAGGIPLIIPKTDLRPTMDMVKGAIFSSLGDWIEGKRVLDLFAGTGGLGIEALSRGCAEATLVEKDHRAVTAIRQNLEKTHLSGNVYEMDIFSYLDRLAPSGGFDLILADPPYAKQKEDRDFTSELLASTNLHNVLTMSWRRTASSYWSISRGQSCRWVNCGAVCGNVATEPLRWRISTSVIRRNIPPTPP